MYGNIDLDCDSNVRHEQCALKWRRQAAFVCVVFCYSSGCVFAWCCAISPDAVDIRERSPFSFVLSTLFLLLHFLEDKKRSQSRSVTGALGPCSRGDMIKGLLLSGLRPPPIQMPCTHATAALANWIVRRADRTEGIEQDWCTESIERHLNDAELWRCQGAEEKLAACWD